MNRRSFLGISSVCSVPPIALNFLSTAASISLDKHKQSTQQLFARWFCELNSWQWPKEWGECPPLFSEEERNKYLGSDFTEKWPGWNMYIDLIHSIESVAGRRECFRYWNVVYQKNMTEEQFNQWWHAYYET